MARGARERRRCGEDVATHSLERLSRGLDHQEGGERSEEIRAPRQGAAAAAEALKRSARW